MEPVRPEETSHPAVLHKPATTVGMEKAKRPLMAALVVAAYLQYLYVDTLLEIARLPSLIVFVLVDGQLPPA